MKPMTEDMLVEMVAMGCDFESVVIEMDVIAHPRRRRADDKRKQVLRFEVFTDVDDGLDDGHGVPQQRESLGTVHIERKVLLQALCEIGAL